MPPPFAPGTHKPKPGFHWWGWHPSYPYWSRSCWGGTTETFARLALTNPQAGKMPHYHKVLVREAAGEFTTIDTVPPHED